MIRTASSPGIGRCRGQCGRIATATLVGAVTALVFASSASASGGKYDNPYIDDNRLTESPLNLTYEVTEVRNFVDQYNLRYLHHYSPANPDTIVNDWKARYKKGAPVSGDYIITGYAFLIQKGIWSFTLKHRTARHRIRIEIQPTETGCIIAMDARKLTMIARRFRRQWSPYQPRGMKKRLKLVAY